MPGETAEQWRGEGYCERMVLTKEMLDKLPSYTITSMVASKRLELEKGDHVEELHDGVSGVSFLLDFMMQLIILFETVISSQHCQSNNQIMRVFNSK
jgi:hypothetical protein